MLLPDGNYFASTVFSGSEWLTNCIITVNNGDITRVVPNESTTSTTFTQQFQAIAPSYIDVQIYGAGGKLFGIHASIDALCELHAYCRKGNADHFAVAVATNELSVFHKSIDIIREYWSIGGKGCLGLHMEGPWISTEKRGAHIESFIHIPTVEEVRSILDYGKGVIKMITIAPEVCSNEVIELIHSYGVTISVGHTNATYSQATACFDSGKVTTVTHLYNAMTPLQHRSPGVVGAVFNHPTVMSSIIVDGFHVDFTAVTIAKKIMKERLFCITDAVTDTDIGPYPHQLVDNNRYESNGTLSGSALTMQKACENLIQYCAIEPSEALRMCSLYPAKAIGIDNRLGRIEVGYKAYVIEWNNSV